jgi:hypothetical protein
MQQQIEWIIDALRDDPELALFLPLAAGYLIGRLRIGSFLGKLMSRRLVRAYPEGTYQPT